MLAQPIAGRSRLVGGLLPFVCSATGFHRELLSATLGGLRPLSGRAVLSVFGIQLRIPLLTELFD
jgi:hypothetical protein